MWILFDQQITLIIDCYSTELNISLQYPAVVMSGSYSLQATQGTVNPAFEQPIENGNYRKNQVGTAETKISTDAANGHAASKPEVNGKMADCTGGEGGSDSDGAAAAAKPEKPPMVGVGEVVRTARI